MKHLTSALAFLSLAATIASRTLLAIDAATAPDIVALRVEGRSNATPWVAANGAFAAVAWGACYR